MRKFRSLSNVEEGYLRDHPDEIDDYMTVLFEEYAKDIPTIPHTNIEQLAAPPSSQYDSKPRG